MRIDGEKEKKKAMAMQHLTVVDVNVICFSKAHNSPKGLEMQPLVTISKNV